MGNLPKNELKMASRGKYFSINQAANYLGISTKTLRRWEASGKIIPVRTKGGHRRYMLSDFAAITQKRVVKPGRVYLRSKVYQNENAKPQESYNVLTPSPVEKQLDLYQKFELHTDQKKALKAITFAFFSILFLILVFKGSNSLFAGVKETNIISELPLPGIAKTIFGAKEYKYSQDLAELSKSDSKVLAAETSTTTPFFDVNVQSSFNDVASFLKGLTSTDVATNTLEATGAATFGDIKNIKGVNYSFPAAQGATSTYLKNNGSGTLTWATVTVPTALTDLTGVLPVSQGGTNNSTLYTAGSVIFSDGTKLTQNNANFFWDDANKKLGLGTTSPNEALDVRGAVYVGDTSAPGTTTNRLYSTTGTLFWNGSSVCTSSNTCSATGTLTGTGTANTIPKFTAASTIGNSLLTDSGSTLSYNSNFSVTSTGVVSGVTGLSLNLGSDATGDVFYRNSSGNVARLGIGSSGQTLTVLGGLPSWVGGSGTGDVGFWNRTGTTLSPSNAGDNIATTGEIGAGTTTPGATLDVQGTLTTNNSKLSNISVTNGNTGAGVTVNGLVITGVGSTPSSGSNTTNLIQLSATALGNNTFSGINFGSGFTNYINNTTWIVTAAGAETLGSSLTSVGVNSQSGLIQGTGGLTLTGTTNINTSGTANTSIGNSTGTFSLASSGLNVTTGGAITGVATLDTITTDASHLTFAGAGTIDTTGANTFNLGTGSTAKTINIGTGVTGNTINIGSAASTTVTIAGIGSGTGSGLCLNGTTLVTCTVGSGGISGSGTSGQIAFFNGTGSITSEASGFGWDTSTKRFTLTSNDTTGTSAAISNTSLTTGKLFSATGTNAATTDTAITQDLFDITNAQTTTANSSFTGVGVNFTNNPSVAGNTENAVRIQNQVTSNTTDNAVASLLLLDNADTAGTGSTKVTDALRITNSGGIAAGITNGITFGSTTVDTGINFASTPTTNYISGANFTVTSAGALTAVGLNSGSGLIQGSGGLTVTGTANINATGSSNTSVGNGSGTVTLTLGSDATGDIFYRNSSGNIARLAIGTNGQTLVVSGSGIPSWAGGTGGTGSDGFWSRSGTTLSPVNSGDNVTTTGNISTTGGGTITSAGLLTGSAGITVSGGVANINVSGSSNTAIGNSSGTFALLSSTGLNVTTGGALSGVATLDTITTDATHLTFAGAGNVLTTTTSALTLDSGTTGDVNLGTGSNAKTITVGNGTGATALNLTSGTGAQTHSSSVATGTGTSGAFVFNDTALTSGDLIYATTSAVTSGNILRLGQGGNTNFTGNVISADIDNTGQGGIGFTGNFLLFKNAGTSEATLTSAGALTLNSNLTFSGSSSTISNSTTNAALTLNSNGSGALTLDSGGSGTVNLGNGGTAKTINIGTGVTGNTVNIGSASSTTVTFAGIASGTGNALCLNGTTLVTCTVGTGGVSGSGTQNTIPKWNNAGGTSLGDSNVSDNGTTVSIAANKNFALNSGTGVFTQTSTVTTGDTFAVTNNSISAAGGNLFDLTYQNNNTAAAGRTVNGVKINATGSTPLSGTNTENLIDLNATALASNTFNGIMFESGLSNYVNSTNWIVTASGAETLASTLTVQGTSISIGNGSAATISTPSSNAGISIAPNGTGVITLTNSNTGGTIFNTGTSTDDQLAVLPFIGGSGRFTGTITSADLTASHTWTLPNADGTICVSGQACATTGTVTSSGSSLANRVAYFTADTVITGNAIYLFNPGATTGTTTSSNLSLADTTLTSGTNLYLSSNHITTGKLLDIADSGNTWTGNGTTNGLINFASSSTAGAASATNILLNLARSGANGNSAVTSYGVYSNVTNTGTTSINGAGFFNATGGDTNYDLNLGAISTAHTTNAAINIGDITGATTNKYIASTNWNVTGAGAETLASDLAVNGSNITTTNTGTFALLNTNATTINAFAAATNINIGSSSGFNLTPGGNLTIPLGNTLTSTITSSLSGGARSTYPLTISQANDASNNNSVGLLSVTNSDTGSTAGALVNLDQVAGGTGINFPTTVSGTSGSPAAINLTVGNGVSATAASGIRISTISNSGTGLAETLGTGSSTTGIKIDISQAANATAILLNGSNSVTTAFTGQGIKVAPTDTFTSSVSNTGNYLNLVRSETASGASTTLTETGDLATLSSNCTTAASGTCVDSSHILNLTQSFGSASGSVFNLTSTGTGDLISASSSGGITSGNLLKLGQGGNVNFTGNAIFADIDNTGQGGIGFTGNFFSFKNATKTVSTLTSGGTLNLTGTATNSDTIALAPNTTGSNAFTGTLTSADLTGTHTWTLPDADGTICVSGQACATTGTVTSSGSSLANRVAYFTADTVITGSSIYTFNPGATTGTTTSSNLSLADTTLTSGTNLYLSSNHITTGKLLDVADTNNTWTGNGTTNGLINFSSSSTAGANNNILLNLARSGANGTSTVTSYGLSSSVTNTGTASTNVGGLFTATGGTTDLGLQVAALTGATSTGLDIGALSGATANKGINIGAITAAATATNFGINIGAITPQASATVASINTSGIAAGAGTATYGLLLGTNASTATTNEGIDIGNITGAGTNNFGINIGTISGAATSNAGINFANSLTTTGIKYKTIVNAIDSGGIGIDLQSVAGSGIGISMGGGALAGGNIFTGSYLKINTSHTYGSGGALTETGNFMNISRSEISSGGGNSLNVTGDLATLTSNCASVSSGTCTDSSHVLSLTQSFGSASGSVFNLTGAGTGDGADLSLTNSSGTQANGILIDRHTGSGTTTSLLNLTDTAGTATNGIIFNGTIGTDITTAAARALLIDSGTTGAINIGTGANGKTITIGNTTANTALALTSGGTGSQTFSSGVTTGGTTSGAFAFTANSLTTGTGMYVNSSSITTGDLLAINSTGTTLTTGNLLNVENNSTSVFSVGASQIVSALPHSFTAAGDVSVAYDIQFTNPVGSFIKSSSPLAIAAGEVFNSSNLTLRTYNLGNIILDSGTSSSGTGKIGVGPAVTPVGFFHVSNTNENTTVLNGKALAVFDQGESQDIIAASKSGTTRFRIANDGRVFMDLPGTQTGHALCHTTDGVITATPDEVVDCTGTLSDYAETYPLNSDVAYGDIVVTGPNLVSEKVVDGNGNVIAGQTRQISKLVKSNTDYQNNVVGIVSNNYSDFSSTGQNVVDPADNPKPVALSGRVPVKIATDSPVIAAGDYLTTSHQPGRATKATSTGRVIGMALTNWTPNSGQDTVLIFVNNTWYTPGVPTTITDGTTTVIPTASGSGQIANATDSASLQAQVTDLQTSFDLFKSVLTATDSGVIANLHEVDTTKLNVLGDTTLGDTVINGKLNIGALTIDNTTQSINAIGVLKLQDLALGNVEFMNGLITFDTKGNATFQSITANKYNVAGTSAGVGIIASGQTSVTISSNQVSSNSLIFVTAQTATAKTLAVTNKIKGTSFVVTIASADTKDIQFSWWIVDKQ